jgi:UDP-2-acetamido-3-amino-2,3-dideoxy-glucuronate N-acetyltransferase
MPEKFIGFIGMGYWGKNIFRNLYELGVLHTACDFSEKTILEMKQKYPNLNFTSSNKEILENPQITAVAIATPAVTHWELAKAALLSGKDVFVEKPLALNVEEGEELVSLAEKQKKILMVGHILQYHPAIIKLKEIISKGELGKIQYIYSNRLNIGKLRTEENILWSFAPHDVSVIIMLVGEEPMMVSAFGGYYLNKGIYDTTLTTLEFKSEIKGHIFVSWLHPYKEQKLVVVGSNAMAVFDDLSEKKLFIYNHKIEWKDGKIPVAHKADYQVIDIDRGEPLRRELEHFILCVKERITPKTDGQEGLRVLRILSECENQLSANVNP